MVWFEQNNEKEVDCVGQINQLENRKKYWKAKKIIVQLFTKKKEKKEKKEELKKEKS